MKQSSYFAHSANTAGQWQKLADHLAAVGQIARKFAAQGNQALSEVACWAGLLHDLGKYRDEFQDYLLKKRESSLETHHAVYGAALAFQRGWIGPAFAIAGHHAGLHDLNELQALVESSSYRAEQRLPRLTERFKQELGDLPELVTEPEYINGSDHSGEFYIRMLFSLLIDADRLDTESHTRGRCRLPLKLDAPALLGRLIAEKNSKSQEGELNAIRSRIFQHCLDRARDIPGFYSLTAPTGGGKTLAGMAFALVHAIHHGLRRVIVVIPYLSIIEQNAAQYRHILDPNNEGLVIEHHSAVKTAEDSQETRPRNPLYKRPDEYAVENWDAPIIVTTSVQFIETLFANQTSRCRKLHNIAGSVVIFDEVQTLPSHLLNPLLNVLRELRDHYCVSFLFSTATQPAFSRRPPSLSEGFQPGEVRSITEDTTEIFRQLRRVAISLPKAGETLGWEDLAAHIAEREQALCVVNVRRHAFELWEKLRCSVPENEQSAVFHLSSAMCAQHRFDILGDDREPQPGTIRSRLRNNQACRLVSTQLIEAGVDVDFPVVWRSLGPLDSIVQAAGRCNRENRLRDEEGKPMMGQVIVFRPEDDVLPRGLYRTATGLTNTLLADIETDRLATDPELFERYFDELYQMVPTDQNIQKERAALHFRKVAELAWVIRDETQPVIVPYGKGRELVETIRNRRVEKDQPRFTRDDLRRLQRYMVNLHRRDFQRLEMLEAIQPLLPNLHIHVLTEGWYHDHLGLLIDQRPTEDFFV